MPEAVLSRGLGDRGFSRLCLKQKASQRVEALSTNVAHRRYADLDNEGAVQRSRAGSSRPCDVRDREGTSELVVDEIDAEGDDSLRIRARSVMGRRACNQRLRDLADDRIALLF